jgi:hypothetical protein
MEILSSLGITFGAFFLYLAHRLPWISLQQSIVLSGVFRDARTTVHPVPSDTGDSEVSSCQERSPPIWPKHLIIVQRRIPSKNSTVGPATTVTYYDFEAGGNLIQVTPDNSTEPALWDLELDNHHSYYFTPETRKCRSVEMSVGILRRTWLDGATSLGESMFRGRSVCGWTKLDFIDYYVDKETGEPSHWYFHSMKATFEVLYYDSTTRPDPKLFEPPEYCLSS